MRKFLADLLSRTDCILSTGHSFWFVTDIEKRTYVEFFEQDNLIDGYKTDADSVVFNEELEEIMTMYRNNELVWGHDEHLKNPKCYCRLYNAVQAHKKEVQMNEIIRSFLLWARNSKNKCWKSTRRYMVEKCMFCHVMVISVVSLWRV